MPFIRTRTINGRKYRSLEERYREGRKVKSRYIRSLGPSDGHFAGEVGAYDGMVESYLNPPAPIPAAPAFSQSDFLAETQAPANDAPAADAGQENAASDSEGGKS